MPKVCRKCQMKDHYQTLNTMGKTERKRGLKKMTDEEVLAQMNGPMTRDLTEKGMKYVIEGWEHIFDGWMESLEPDCMDEDEKNVQILDAWDNGNLSEFEEVLVDTTKETIKQGYPVTLKYMRRAMKTYFCNEFHVKYNKVRKIYYID